MKPKSGGKIANAKAQPLQRQSYGKMSPAKKPGLHGDNPRGRKASPIGRKK